MSNQPPGVSFRSHHESFAKLLGIHPTITLLAEDSNEISSFHEACVYHKPSKSIFVTSNQIPLADSTEDSPTANKIVKLYRIYDPQTNNSSTKSTSHVEDVTPAILASSLLNGGVNYGDSSILLCAQGSKRSSDMSGIVEMKVPSPGQTAIDSSCQVLISDFHGRAFNSVNDVIVHPKDGSIWFTDPCYGFHQGIRNKPELPNQVYRYDPKIHSIRAVANGFTRCNGLCFSPDCQILYVTDTGAVHGSSEIGVDPMGPSHIYAFDVLSTSTGGVFLANKRLFAYADGVCPDGIKCDTDGNVYSGCWDGVEVWNSDGILIGRILVQGGVANFCFGERGAIYMCNETRVWKAQLESSVVGALLNL